MAVSIGAARPTPGRKAAKTGIFKVPVDHPVMIGREGLAGDRIVNAKHHGGPDQAVYIECSADLDWWAGELGHPVPPGTFGENLTIEGMQNGDLAVGDRLAIGEVVVEVTAARIPCSTFAARMDDPTFVRRYLRAGRPGAYARVLTEGIVTAGDGVAHTPYPGERITMPEMLRNHGRRLGGADLARHLAAPISARVRDFLNGAGATQT
jgi:MOSC domain-containing protein YiiM